jgi:hypothetical protein
MAVIECFDCGEEEGPFFESADGEFICEGCAYDRYVDGDF